MRDGPRLENLEDGRVRVHYGGGRGYETFDSIEDVRNRMRGWISRRHGELAQDLAALCKFERDIYGRKQ